MHVSGHTATIRVVIVCSVTTDKDLCETGDHSWCHVTRVVVCLNFGFVLHQLRNIILKAIAIENEDCRACSKSYTNRFKGSGKVQKGNFEGSP